MRRIAFLLVILLFYSCRETTPVDQIETKEPPNYYPLTKGSYWIYSIDTSDANGENFGIFGTRKSTIAGFDTLLNKKYALQVDTIITPTATAVDTIYIRKDDFGLYIFTPPLNLSSLIIIPAHELKLLPYPLESLTTLSWVIYDTTFYLGTIPIARLNLTGQLIGYENIQVPAGNFYCVKINIIAKGFIVNPQNILQPYQFNLSGLLWLNKEVGLIKTETPLPLSQILQGTFSNLSDSLRIVKQGLWNYKIN